MPNLSYDDEPTWAPRHGSGKVVQLSNVEPERVEWLWPGYIPLGKLTVMDGDPGLGKSTIMIDVAARISSARVMPDGSRGHLDAAAGVLLLSAEDGLADTVRPRLAAAGADLERTYAFEAVHEAVGERPFVLPQDAQALEDEVTRTGATLVVIDPLMAFLGPDVNSHRDQDVRRALALLSGIAERTGCAIVVVRHLNKAAGGNPLYRGGGSIGIIAAARSGLLIAKDPDDPEGERRILASTKSNLGPKPAALAYRLVATGDTSRVDWLGESSHTPETLLAPPLTVSLSPARREAADFLETELANGPVPSGEVLGEARAAGISKSTLDRAKRELGVESRKVGDVSEGHWEWRLAEDRQPIRRSPSPEPWRSSAELGDLRLDQESRLGRATPERPNEPKGPPDAVAPSSDGDTGGEVSVIPADVRTAMSASQPLNQPSDEQKAIDPRRVVTANPKSQEVAVEESSDLAAETQRRSASTTNFATVSPAAPENAGPLLRPTNPAGDESVKDGDAASQGEGSEPDGATTDADEEIESGSITPVAANGTLGRRYVQNPVRFTYEALGLCNELRRKRGKDVPDVRAAARARALDRGPNIDGDVLVTEEDVEATAHGLDVAQDLDG